MKAPEAKNKPRKIILDARYIKDPFIGLARYTICLLLGLLTNDSSIIEKLTIILDKNINYDENRWYRFIKKMNDARLKIQFLDAPVFSVKHHKNVSHYVNKSDCDLYIYPHYDAPLFVKKKTVFIVHDLLPFVIENYIVKYKSIKKAYIKYLIELNAKQRNKHCIAVSNCTKHDIVNILNISEAKVGVVYETHYIDIIEMNRQEASDLNLPEHFLLYVGSRRPHKNLAFTINVFERLKSECGYGGHLVIIGPEDKDQNKIDTLITKKKYITYLGTISDFHLERAYKLMDALFLSSLYEGFGLPIVEAARFGKKIITSDRSSMKEIAPSWSLLIDPMNEDFDKVAHEIKNYLTREETVDHESYFFNSYSWKQVAEKLINV